MNTKSSVFRVGKAVRYTNKVGVIPKRRLWIPVLSMMVLFASLGGGAYVNRYAIMSFIINDTIPRAQAIAPGEDTKPAPNAGDIAKAALQEQDELLATKISSKISEFPSKQEWSVYVYDINTGRSASINADKVYPAASLYKLFLLAPLESKMEFGNWKSRIGSTTVSGCVQAMLQVSDNQCAQSIASVANWQYVDKSNEQNGFIKTKVAGRSGQQTTPREVGELLTRLKKGQMLSDSARRLVFDALYNQKYDKGIPRGCGDCRTANKTGDINGYVHDAGVVTHGPNSYILVAMSKGGSFNQIAELTEVVDTQLYMP